MNTIKQTALTAVSAGLFLCILDETAIADVTEGIIVFKSADYSPTYTKNAECTGFNYQALNVKGPSYVTWVEEETVTTPSDYVAVACLLDLS